MKSECKSYEKNQYLAQKAPFYVPSISILQKVFYSKTSAYYEVTAKFGRK
jgi:hypothetical protein